MIFNTKNFLVRKLVMGDLDAFHKLESNINVLRYADGKQKAYQENKKELKELINKYNTIKNDFWIYAVESKQDKVFVGTVALVKDNLDDEIGYRFLEKFWGLGYGSEVCKGLISYCAKIRLNKIVAYVVDENIASAKILKKNNFTSVRHYINDENQAETKYQLKL